MQTCSTLLRARMAMRDPAGSDSACSARCQRAIRSPNSLQLIVSQRPAARAYCREASPPGVAAMRSRNNSGSVFTCASEWADDHSS
jgi:hypothetical protein